MNRRVFNACVMFDIAPSAARKLVKLVDDMARLREGGADWTEVSEATGCSERRVHSLVFDGRLDRKVTA